MSGMFGWIRRFIRELRRRRVIRVAVVYASAGFVILELADILQPALALPSWTVRFVAALLILGFPLAAGLAWVYNLTEEGVIRDPGEEETVEGEGSPFTSNGLIVGLLILVAGLLLYPWMFPTGEEIGRQASPADTARVEERSIAVLPFEALSSGAKSRTFARGVHDDLLTRLANISALTVLSRTAVRQYRDTDLTTGQIADSLGVRWILEGGVQVLGDQIQVNAQLIDPRTEAHVWAEDYRRALTAEDLFAIQGEITQRIADALKARLTAGEQRRIAGAPTDNLQAYRLYVKGRSQLDTRSEDGMRRAVDYFQQALREDSSFALAWAGLADAIGLYPTYGPDSLSASVPSHQEAAQRALELDPSLAEAHASMGFFYYSKQQNAPAALRHLKRAVELKPSYAQAHHWLGLLQLGIGRPKKALRHARRAVDLNPQHVSANRVLAEASLANGAAKEALTQARTAWRMDPNPLAAGMEITALQRLGRVEEARKAGERALPAVDSTGQIAVRGYLAMAEAAAGDLTRAEKLLASDRSDIPPFGYGLLYGATGNLDAAFQAFGTVKEWNPTLIVIIRYFYADLLGPLRRDPRYETLIQKINQQWGLHPDGTLPGDTSVSTEPRTDA